MRFARPVSEARRRVAELQMEPQEVKILDRSDGLGKWCLAGRRNAVPPDDMLLACIQHTTPSVGTLPYIMCFLSIQPIHRCYPLTPPMLVIDTVSGDKGKCCGVLGQTGSSASVRGRSPATIQHDRTMTLMIHDTESSIRV